MSDEIQAFVDEDPVEVELVRESGPAPRATEIAEHRQPAFFRVHYVTQKGAIHAAWRLADCEGDAIDLVIYSFNPPVRIVRLARFDTRQELIDALPPERAIRSVFPPDDLKLAHRLGLLLERDITP